jgi:protein tyrosine phosphatase
LNFSDGAGRTGTYIAISNLLERMKIEQAMDVFQSIKIIRGARPQFVENAVSTKIITFSNIILVPRRRGRGVE